MALKKANPFLVPSISCVALIVTANLVYRSQNGTRTFVQRSQPVVPITISGESAKLERSDIGWPQLRGPTYDSHSAETGLADTWPEAGPPVLWTRELGQGYSGFAAVGNRVYTLTQSLYQQSVVCLDAQTGETVWSHHYGWPFEGGGLYPGPRSTPTIRDGRVYYSAPDGMIGCLDANDGHSLWSCNPKKTFRGRGTDFGYASSPVVIGDRVIVPVGGLDESVVALDISNGATLWKSGGGSASYATPLPITLRGRSLVVTPLENSIAAFDVDTGVQLWEIQSSVGYDEHSAAPIYREPFLFIASPFRSGAKSYRLPEIDAAVSEQTREGMSLEKPKVVWESAKFSNDVASSVLVDGRVYGFDLKDPQSRLDRPSRGEFRCIEFETGRIIWSTDKVGQSNAIIADQKLILFTDRGELILARLGTDQYVELSRTQVFRDETCWTYPALHRGCLYLRTQTRAACIDLRESKYAISRPVTSVQDIPRGRALDAKWLIGGEREFPATVPEWSEFQIWYFWSVGCLLLSSLLSISIASGMRFLTSGGGLKLPGNRLSVRVSRVCFWFLAILMGITGSPVINSLQSEYVLLWPLVLWLSFQLTINLITWTECRSDRRRMRWISRICGVLFVGECIMYFHLCRILGYAIEWSFLVGFLPGFAFAAIASRFLTARSRIWPLTDFVVSVLSFSAYFWSSILFIKWKMTVGS